MRRLVLGTAGHIDHGKTSLVRALTGIDTDRLPDEKRRGITIDLGFASLPLPDGGTLSIVDVPGHEAFIRNMLAGATGIDMVLLVVAADEGAMPQTREHLDIIRLLGIRRGIVALTKADLVEPEWLDLVREDVAELLGGTALEGSPILPVSARTGAGVTAVAAALSEMTAAVPPRLEDDLFRMPIDRVFTVRGTGTVVTGTVWSGTLRRDAHVNVLPAGFDARVRGLQQHGVECDEVVAGARAAIALGGTERQALSRGDTLLGRDGWEPSAILTVQLRRLEDAPPIRTRQRVRVHVGTAEVLGRVALLDDEPGPGESTIAQLRLEAPVIARTGDHFVLRSYSPVHSIAGGIVLEAPAPKRKRLAAPAGEALRIVAERLAGGTPDILQAMDILGAAVTLAGPQGIEAGRVPFASGLPPRLADAALARDGGLVATAGRIVSADRLRSAEDAVLTALENFHRRHPMLDGMEREALRRTLDAPELLDIAIAGLLARARVATAGSALARTGHHAAPDPAGRAALEDIAAVYLAARLEPPDTAELPAALAARPDLPLLLRFLERDGTLIRLGPTRLIDASAVSDAVVALRSQLPAGSELEMADFKDVLKLTRKHLIPLLEHLDGKGITRRMGDRRLLTPVDPVPLDA